jgi:hypothetical protein
MISIRSFLHLCRVAFGLAVMLVAAGVPAPVRSADFPLSVSGDGRHFLRADGSPWRLQAFAAWTIATNGTPSTVPTYFDAVASYGFNAVYVMAATHPGAYWAPAGAPNNYNGAPPFATASDLSSANSSDSGVVRYWANLDWIIDQAALRGIAVVLWPAYLGYPNTGEGWWSELGSMSTPSVRNYGSWIGNRYKGKTNVIWAGLGDQTPSGVLRTNAIALIDSIKAVAPQPWAAEAMGGNSSPALLADVGSDIATRIDMHSFYGYGPGNNACNYDKADESYSSIPPKPVWMQEPGYENVAFVGTGASWETQRSRLWSVTGGATAGDGFGSDPAFYLRGAIPGIVQTEGARLSKLAFELLGSIPWQSMVPQPNWTGAGARATPVLVTSGRGTHQTKDWITASVTMNGSHAVVYVPPTGTSPRSFTVDASQMGAGFNAKWWDPNSGALATIGSFPDSGTLTFTTPGANSSGARNDWVLVLAAESGGGALAIAPATASTSPLGTVQLGASGGSGTGYTWSLATNESGGSISAGGLYTAGISGNVTDVVRVTDSLGAAATRNVSVTAGVSISPATASTSPRGTVQMSASGVSGAGYAWTLATNASGGSISAGGLYAAGPTGAVSDVLRVTDSTGNIADATVGVASAPAQGSGGCGSTAGPESLLALLVMAVRRRWPGRLRSTFDDDGARD